MDLNLDFDIAPKIVSISENKEEDLGFIKDDVSDGISFNEKNDNITPNLNVSDGVELLSNNFGIKEEPKKEEKSDDFSFFKVEDKGGIVDGDLKEPVDPKNDNFIMNNSSNDDNGGYKPIHRLISRN